MKANLLRTLAIGSLLPLQCLAANVDISINPTPASLAAGESSFVDLVGNYDGNDKLLGGAISLNFRADLLEVIAVTLKAPSDVAGTSGSIVISGNNGTVSGIGFASFGGVSGSFNLATIEFKALGSGGVSPLTAFDPGDPIYAWVNEAFDSVGVSSTPSSIAVTAVPEPASAAMMFAGLALIGGAARMLRG